MNIEQKRIFSKITLGVAFKQYDKAHKRKDKESMKFWNTIISAKTAYIYNSGRERFCAD